MAEQQDNISKQRLCKLFSVVRSSYYYSVKETPIDVELLKLKALVRQAYKQSGGSAGARTISAIITNHHNIKLTRYRADKLMVQMGLVSRQMKLHKYKYSDTVHRVYDNVLDRQFTPTAPNQVWTGDVTYIRIKGGWCYLAVVMDLYARRIVGFKLSDSPNTELTTSALNMAYHTRLEPKEVLFHSDQGSHYTSEDYARCMAGCNDMTHSMSRKGTRGHSPCLASGQSSALLFPSSWDNAPTERFFRSFKIEW